MDSIAVLGCIVSCGRCAMSAIAKDIFRAGVKIATKSELEKYDCPTLYFVGYWDIPGKRKRPLREERRRIIMLLHLQPVIEQSASASPRRCSTATQNSNLVDR